MLFIAFSFYRVLGGAAGWIEFITAIVAGLIGVQFVYSGLTGRWTSLFERLNRDLEERTPGNFLVVDPVSCEVSETNVGRASGSPMQAVNPYAPPSDLDATLIADGTPNGEATLQVLTQQFLDGHRFIHYGVVFFLDPGDDASIHAALPLVSQRQVDARRNVDEAIRVLPEFLDSLPAVRQSVVGRNLVIRMVKSYERFDQEVAERVVVP
ncbi:hypothetical protein Mal15_55230 [Stieleria maiorica]|uniref:Uncharacterized protein n=1 Tax=Stieleria maiorica TaxID=2795974 RepID=A0A5B9MND8_9BACT|nr:hypothetical protein [Stieleria maiorica]QEG01447.1 hypothetical protein Mal15_55230 [Stieleria maiorica]